MIEFVPYLVSSLLCIFLIESDHIYDNLRVLLLLLLRDTAIVNHALPFFGKTLG
jgi:hypothetical protein